MKDEEIIPYLLKLNRPTFFTRDDGFYEPKLCHLNYCLVHLALRKDEVATFVRRFLRNQEFNTKVKRMGCVIRVTHVGLTVFRSHHEKQMRFSWLI